MVKIRLAKTLRRNIALFLGGGVLAAGMSTSALGAVFYVDPVNGSMGNDGSSTHPWSTLEEVFANALVETRSYPSYVTVNPGAPVKAGDTIRLRTGYHGILNYQNAHNTAFITIEADPGHTPRLKGVALGGVSKWILRGLTISPSFDMPLDGGNIVRLSNHDVHGPTSDITIENCTIYTIDNPAGMTAAERDAQFSGGVRFMGLSNITVRNNVLRNVNDGIVCHGTNLVIENNRIDGFQIDAISSGGQNIAIRFNTITNLYEVNVANHCDGIQMFNADGGIVEHVVIEGNRIVQYDRGRTDAWTGSLQGIGCFGGPYGDFHVINNVVITDMYHGITILDTQYDCSIINNTIVDIIPDNDLVPYITVKDQLGTAQNCIIRNNISAFFAYPDRPSIVADHNIVLDNQAQMFANVAAYDVHLRAGAPAIDAGTSLSAPSTDIEGTARYRGNAVDAGAYESPYSGDTTSPPVISSVVINPSSGTIGIGDQVTITVTAEANESGLSASNASFNGTSVPLADQGNGTYTGTYTVSEGAPDGINVNATGITLTGTNGTSATASSSGSTLHIDANAPEISSIELIPSSGVVYAGDPITIRVRAAGSESGLAPSNATLLGHQVALGDVGGGVYEGTYIVRDTDSAQEFAPNLVFSDGFESGSTSGWTVSTGDIAVSNTAKIASKGLEYTIRSPQAATMYRNLGNTYDDTYTSFYLRLGTSFSMPDNETIYLNFAKGANGGAWATRLRKRNGTYEIVVTLGGHVIDVGSWTAIQRGEWYWIKVHYRSASSGRAEWWLNSSSRGSYTGDTGDSTFNMIYAYYLGGFDDTVYGPIHCDHFQVSTGDHAEPSIIEASGIALSDAAGNTSMSAATSGSTLSIGYSASPPVIASVTLSPSSGVLETGDSVLITVTAQGDQSGLIASPAIINGRQVTLTGQGDGTYTGTYTVSDSDPSATTIEATGITLSDPAGPTSAAASSSGSTLSVQTNASGVPVIASVMLSPANRAVKAGDIVTITVTAVNREILLTPSPAAINGKSVPLSEQGNGIYVGWYEVSENDQTGAVLEASGITLANVNGTSATASSVSSGLVVDNDPPAIASADMTPSAGIVGLDGTVTITVRATNKESGLTVGARFNTVPLTFTDMGSGTYSGIYTVADDHVEAFNVECVGIVLTDSAGNQSASISTTGSTLHIAPDQTAVSEDMPGTAALHQNYPNPFNASTTIPFTVPAAHGADHVTITIYNVAGQAVRHLFDRTVSPGMQSVRWDGCDDRGMVVSAGFYLVEFHAGSYRSMKRMVFLK